MMDARNADVKMGLPPAVSLKIALVMIAQLFPISNAIE